MNLGSPDHIGMIVADLDEAKRTIGAAHGLDWGTDSYPDLVVQADGVVQEVSLASGVSVQGPPHIELLQCASGNVWEAPGKHHLGFAVDDVAETVRQLEELGYTKLVEPVIPLDVELRWTYLASPQGLAIEVFNRTTERELALRRQGGAS